MYAAYQWLFYFKYNKMLQNIDIKTKNSSCIRWVLNNLLNEKFLLLRLKYLLTFEFNVRLCYSYVIDY